MKLKGKFVKATILMAVTLVSLSHLAQAAAEPEIIKPITVVNNSTLTLKPTAEGLSNGCIGGSIPEPVEPGTTKEIKVHFIQYASPCTFNVLPQPHIMTDAEACHNVKVNATVTFSGTDTSNLTCQVKNN
ncbi:MAG: hypothetical protein EPO11_06030 [Gammaproteobacteria bacterium]|nr:MAG: hypothetical protein EPO11_06030 [Gammaproteobacteria bacterium]